MSVRVRYAPSPTGHLHIGNARTALFNYLFAKRHQGAFIIRIEDTDVKRNVETGIDNQLSLLKWLGIDWDESIDREGEYGPYRQLERLALYQDYAQQLLDRGLAYKCYCSSEELEAEREALKAKGDDKLHYSRKCLHAPDQDAPHTIRFKVPDDVAYTFDDVVKGSVTFQSEAVGDWVILKRNGIPTYNFACAVDDHHMAISHVLRGEDHITNTPRQLMIFDAFNWERPKYGHMTLIVNEHGKKLSKRDETIIQFIEQYKNLGFLPEALFNFIALLGFSPQSKEEVLSREAIIDLFDENRLSSSPATFDKDKLAFINNRHMKSKSLTEIMALCLPYLKAENIAQHEDASYIESLVGVFQDRLVYGAQIVDLYHDFFDEAFELDQEALDFLHSDEGIVALLKHVRDAIKETDTFDADTLKNIIKLSGKATGMKGKMLFMPVRIAVSAKQHGPDLPKMMHLLGKDRLIERINATLNAIA